MRLHKNDNGMTLIELIISLAISAIILTMIIMIISSASKSFRRTGNEVNLQKEAQVTINQLTNLLMEANDINISSNLLPTSDDKKYLITYLAENYAVLFIKKEQKLYLIKDEPMLPADDVIYTDSDDFTARYLMAEFVKDFEIKDYDTKKVTVAITFEIDDKEYSTSRKIVLRNKR